MDGVDVPKVLFGVVLPGAPNAVVFAPNKLVAGLFCVLVGVPI